MHISIILILAFSVNAQLNWDSYVVNDDSQISQLDVIATDLDKDGDLDLIGISDDCDINLYENLNGTGDFSDPILLTQAIEKPSFILPNDIDLDGDIDLIIGSFWGPNQLYWLLNKQESNEGFLLKSPFETAFTSLYDPVLADLDGDLDLDLICRTLENIYWYENLNESFGSRNEIFRSSFVDYYFINDIDGDGDEDLLVKDVESISFRANDGNGSFSNSFIPHLEVNEFTFSLIGDLDGDEDLDILGHQLGNGLVWFENLRGANSFDTPKVISSIPKHKTRALIDIDNDNDLDIVSELNNKFYWFENKFGNGKFNMPILLSQDSIWRRFKSTPDLNGDSYPDLLVTDSKSIKWFENPGVYEKPDLDSPFEVNIAPNPTKNSIQVITEEEIVDVQVFSGSGILITSNISYHNIINMEDFQNGIYFIKIFSSQNRSQVLKVVKY